MDKIQKYIPKALMYGARPDLDKKTICQACPYFKIYATADPSYCKVCTNKEK